MPVKSYRFRLYPTKSQRKELSRWLGICRYVYNATLEKRRDVWAKNQQSLTTYDTNKLLPEWKDKRPWLKDVHAQILQNAQRRVDKAFQNFFRRIKSWKDKVGYPRFKGAHRYNSFCFPQYPKGAVLEDKALRIRKIGSIKLNLHRPVKGKIKTTTIHRTSTGKWFVIFSVLTEVTPLPASKKVVGIDLGLESFATNDRGVKISNPRFFRSSEKSLAQVRRRLDRSKKGSKEYKARRKAVAKVYEKIKNKRANFAHQLSRHLVNKYSTIVFENLTVERMLKNHCLSKSISDAAWTQVIQYTTYKAEEAGRNCVLVNPAYTSQDCSRWGHREKKSLKQRTHECGVCGLVLDRDHNAALNILRLGLQSLADSA